MPRVHPEQKEKEEAEQIERDIMAEVTHEKLTSFSADFLKSRPRLQVYPLEEIKKALSVLVRREKIVQGGYNISLGRPLYSISKKR